MCNYCCSIWMVLICRYFLHAMDRYWHHSCLKCSLCGTPLADIGTSCFLKNDMILCRNDYIRWVSYYFARVVQGRCNIERLFIVTKIRFGKFVFCWGDIQLNSIRQSFGGYFILTNSRTKQKTTRDKLRYSYDATKRLCALFAHRFT